MIDRIKKAFGNKKGFTIVEQIVAFTLFELLTVAAALIMSECLNSYYSIKDNANAQIVAQTLLEKITGEISGALPATTSAGGGTNHHITVSKDKSMIEFDERSGSSVYMFVKNEKLVIHYRPVSDGTLQLAAVDWNFDDRVYKNNAIEKLDFEILGGTDVIKVNLTLRSKTGAKYDFSSYAQCFNYRNEVDNITYGTITTSD